MSQRAALSPKQKRFVAEYLVDLNATQASIRAGYSLRRAAQNGYELLRKGPVAQGLRPARLSWPTGSALPSRGSLPSWPASASPTFAMSSNGAAFRPRVTLMTAGRTLE